MKCPHCKTEHESIMNMFDTPVLKYLDRYGGDARSVTTCCGRVVVVEAITCHRLSKPYSNPALDDWGNEASE